MSVEFLGLATLFLLAAVIAVPISKKLGMGSVLGYLAAGIALAPGLSYLGVDAVAISHFAEFGVVMMLFLVGLELEPRKFLGEAGPILGIGGGQMLVTTAAITGILMLFGLPWQMSLAIGLALGLSSTAIALQSLGEMGELRSQSGQRAFNVLLFQDIAVIPILAAAPLLAANPEVFASVDAMFSHAGDAGDGHGTDSHGKGDGDDAHGDGHGDDSHGHGSQPGFFQTLPSWAYGLSVIGVIGGTMLGGRYVLNPLFASLARTHILELMTAAALLVVVAVSFLMGQLGLSAALGAFVAGVALADSEYRHELEGNIEPFKGLLMGLFFMSVGASIQFDLIINEPLLIVGGAVVLVALKMAILAPIGWFIGLRNGGLFLFVILLGQGGEFGFVLFQALTTEAVVPNSLASRINAIIAISMLMTPLILLAFNMLIAPRLEAAVNEEAESDVENEGAGVIVAGFSPFGQIVARLLLLNGFQTTVLDTDADQIERLKRFGAKIFYGDAARADLLKSAGADEAKLLIITDKSPERVLRIAETAKHHYPHLKMLALAHDRGDAYRLIHAGVDIIERQAFEGGLKMGEQALIELGVRPYQAHRSARKFGEQDRASLEEQSRVFMEGGTDALIMVARNYQKSIEEQFARDAELRKSEREVNENWQPRDKDAGEGA